MLGVPSYNQGLFLALCSQLFLIVLGGPYIVPEMELWLAICKATSLTPTLLPFCFCELLFSFREQKKTLQSRPDSREAGNQKPIFPPGAGPSLPSRLSLGVDSLFSA